MNTRKIEDKILYEEYLNLKEFSFRLLVYQNDAFSDLNFIDHFKDRLPYEKESFWEDIIVNSRISIKELFKRYKKYLMNDLIYEQVHDTLNSFFPSSPNFQTSGCQRMKEYLNEYEKNSR